MSYYSKRRRKAGLSKSEVANALDMDYGKYELIDRGILRMPNRFMDAFNNIVNKTKTENVIEKMTREEIVNEWWDEMCTKTPNGKFGMIKQLHKFNIATMSELDQLLGYSSLGATSNYLNRGNTIGFDLKNKYYSFFENELNIQPPKVSKVKGETGPKSKKYAITYKGNSEYEKLLKWYEGFDFKEWCHKNNITRDMFIVKSGLSQGSVNNVLNKNYASPYLKTLQKLKAFIETCEGKPVNGPMGQVMTFTAVPAEEVPEDIRQMGRELAREVNENMSLKDKLIEKYKYRIDKIQNIIKQHEAIITELKRDISIYEKVLEDLNED